MKRILVVFAAALLAAQDGVRTGTCRSRPLPGAAHAVARFELPAAPFEWTLKPNAAGGPRAFDLTFPSAVTGTTKENDTVACRVWMPKEEGPAPRPGVVLLHYLRSSGGFRPMEEAAKYFAAKGFVSMLLFMPYYGPRADPDKKQEMISDNVASTVANFKQAVLDIRRAGDWLRAQKDVDPSRIGLFGVSLGAVVGSLVAGADPRFTRSVFVVGGGDLPAIVLNESRETAKMRRSLLDAGWTAEKLAAALKPIEPLEVAGRLDPSNVLLLNATDDEVVPRECTEKLRAAMGGPRIRWFKANHYTIALALIEILKEASEHLSIRPSA